MKQSSNQKTKQPRNQPSVPRQILLNPGPATTTDRVKYAQIVPDICPREALFGSLMQSISTDLTQFVGDPEAYTTVLLGGSGTAAVESILSSVVRNGVLIINNGAYGQRMIDICEVYQIPYQAYESSPIAPIDMTLLSQFLDQHCSKESYSHLAIVHNETTSGLLNDIKSVSRLCQKHNLEMIVDAMSSYAAIPIDMAQDGIHYLAASSNKNLQGMAGVSFVIANQKALLATQDIPPRSYYLDLYSQYDTFFKTQQSRFTPPVQTLFALKEAITELKEEGLENRYARYTQSWKTLIKGLSSLGLSTYVPKEHHSRIITAIKEPTSPNYSFDEMCAFFYSHGVTIYPGKISQLPTFRIANIGDINADDIRLFLTLLETYLEQLSESP